MDTQITVAIISGSFLLGVAIVGMVQALTLNHQKKANAAAKASTDKQKYMEDGMQALLRDRIMQACNYYMDKGWMPIYARENIQHMYEAYHGLGGNGTVTELVNRTNTLPFEEDK